MRKFVRQTLTIARRDFTAIVLTPTFLIFLLAPLLMLSFGAIGGFGAAKMSEGDGKARIVVLTDAPRAVVAADHRLRGLFDGDHAPAPLTTRAPGADPAATARAVFEESGIEAEAVLYGPLARPTILRAPGGERDAAYLGALAEEALRADARPSLSRATTSVVTRAAATDSGRQAAGYGAVFAMFFLTLLLSGQSVGMLAEERGNKVIEILAAAVPLEAVFLGKLIGMFGVAVVFVSFWALVLSQAAGLIPGGAATHLSPAIGMTGFVLLFVVYFTLAFLLFGAVFLGVGAQASTMREIQMLSLPITMFQVGMFALASAAASNPGATIATVAAILPFSSPFAMAARAATDPGGWPHLAAIGWQLGWLALTVWVSARLFRRGVLKSGGGLRRLFGRST